MTKRESLKLFIEEHKVGLAVMVAVTLTGVAAYAVSRTAVNGWNNFLEEQNLTDAFYLPGE